MLYYNNSDVMLHCSYCHNTGHTVIHTLDKQDILVTTCVSIEVKGYLINPKVLQNNEI